MPPLPSYLLAPRWIDVHPRDMPDLLARHHRDLLQAGDAVLAGSFTTTGDSDWTHAGHFTIERTDYRGRTIMFHRTIIATINDGAFYAQHEDH